MMDYLQPVDIRQSFHMVMAHMDFHVLALDPPAAALDSAQTDHRSNALGSYKLDYDFSLDILQRRK